MKCKLYLFSKILLTYISALVWLTFSPLWTQNNKKPPWILNEISFLCELIHIQAVMLPNTENSRAFCHVSSSYLLQVCILVRLFTVGRFIFNSTFWRKKVELLSWSSHWHGLTFLLMFIFSEAVKVIHFKVRIHVNCHKQTSLQKGR
jgi:hypothetical protein